jgi:signal transduction histidine kinase
MTEGAIRLLLVEDNPGDAGLLRESLAELSGPAFDVSHAARLSEAVTRLRAAPFDVVLLDLSLPDSQGLDTVSAVHTEAPRTPIVVLTGLADEAVGFAAVRHGAQDYLVKGQADALVMARAIRYAIERQHAEDELAEYRDHLEQLVAERTAALETTNRILQQQMVERARAEEQLQAAHRRLMTESERQRRALAAELHESVSQDLIALKLALTNIMTSEKASISTAVADAINEAMSTCATLARQVRNISHGLYPPALETLGLVASLRQTFRSYQAPPETSVISAPHLESQRFPADVEVALFRIAQEAVHNAVRHSGAGHITLTVDCEADDLRLVVADDGTGFDLEKAAGKGLGLVGMRERALAVHGDLQITSRPGETRVEVRIPSAACRPFEQKA